MRSLQTPRTVLLTTDAVGGVWIYTLELARGLSERGLKVIIASMGQTPSAAQVRSAAQIENVTFESRPYKLEWMENPWDDVEAAGEWLLALESRYAPDIIHLNNFAHGALPWSAPVLVVGHSCVCSWFEAVKGEIAPREWNAYRAAVQRGLRGADAVTAPTGAMLKSLRRHYGRFEGAGVVYNARRTDSLKPRHRKPFVLTAGRLWDEAKNINVLDAAARQIEWPVLAAGPVDNPDGGRIEFDAVRLLGSLDPPELGRWMGSASIYALPARYEPFGLTALEAAHAGCGLVLGDIPTLREIWGDAAVFVPPNDCDALVQAVNDLVRKPDLLEEMANRAARRASEFSVDRMIESYLALYARLLEAGRRPSRRAETKYRPMKQLQK